MRTYTPRTITPAKTAEDLKFMSEKLIQMIGESESRLELLYKSEQSLNLLNDVKNELLEIKLVVEKCKSLNNACNDFINSIELAKVYSAQENIENLNKNIDLLMVLKNSLPLLHLLNNSVESLHLLQSKKSAIEFLDSYIQNLNNIGILKRYWNRLMDFLKFKS